MGKSKFSSADSLEHLINYKIKIEFHTNPMIIVTVLLRDIIQGPGLNCNLNPTFNSISIE